MEHPREKEEQQGHQELEAGLEHHLVKGEELECHLGKGEGREYHPGKGEELEYHPGKGEELEWCCQEVEAEVECQILLGVVEVVGLLMHQNQEVEEGQERCLVLLEVVVEEEGEGEGLLHQVLLAVEEVEGEVVAEVKQLRQAELVLLVLLVGEEERGWKQNHTLPLSFCFVLPVELF